MITTVKEKQYSLRVNFSIKAATDSEAQKKMELIMKELPKMEGVNPSNASLWSFDQKKVICHCE